MTTIYVIEMVIENDVVTSHIFLTEESAYKKFLDLIDAYYAVNDGTVDSIHLIKKEIDDVTGISQETLLDKSIFLEDKDKD